MARAGNAVTLEALMAEVKRLGQLLGERTPSLPYALKIDDAAELMSMSPAKLRGLIRAGVILTCGGGEKGNRMVSRSEIEKFCQPTQPVTRPVRPRKSAQGYAKPTAAARRAFIKSLKSQA